MIKEGRPEGHWKSTRKARAFIIPAGIHSGRADLTQQAKAGRVTLTKASIVFSMLAGAGLRTYHLFVAGLAAPFHPRAETPDAA